VGKEQVTDDWPMYHQRSALRELEKELYVSVVGTFVSYEVAIARLRSAACKVFPGYQHISGVCLFSKGVRIVVLSYTINFIILLIDSSNLSRFIINSKID
jgi:hypothetical protein